jgi:hypothetical protein
VAIKPIGKASIEIVAKGLEQVTQQLEALRVAVSRLTSDTERDVNKATKAAEDGYKKQEKAAEKAAESVEKLAAKQADAAKKAEEIGKAGRTGFGALDDAVGKAGQKIQDSTEGLRKFQGALSGIIGVVTGLAAVGWHRVRRLLKQKMPRVSRKHRRTQKLLEETGKTVRDSAREYLKAAEEISEEDKIRQEAAQRIAELTEKTREAELELVQFVKDRTSAIQILLRGKQGELELQRKLAEDSKALNDDIKASVLKIAEERDARLAKLEAERNKKAEQEAAELAKKQAQIEQSLADQLEAIRISGLEGADRIDAEYQSRRREREQRYREAVEEGRTREAELIDAIDRKDDENAQRAIDRIRKQEDERAKAEQDRQKQEQQRQEDKASQELAAALRETQRALAEQAKAINENTREVRGLRERVFNFTPDIRRVAENTSRRTR